MNLKSAYTRADCLSISTEQIVSRNIREQPMTRKYEQKQRAKQQEETRLRIIEATIALHEEVGGGAPITSIAERAGVGRVTLYRHFPDEKSLLSACTGHYLTVNPPPDSAAWRGVADPECRLRTALGEIYAYYRRTEGLLARAEQEAPANPVLAEVLEPFAAYWRDIRDILVEGWRGGPLVTAAIGHAIAFGTWRSLVREQGLDDDQAITLMTTLVHCASR
jgi:AcrR family transcriptional regulator